MKMIITADWHLRKDTPRCRIDEDWIETQRKTIASIYNKAAEYKCNIWNIGDVFHTCVVPPSIINMVLDTAKKRKYQDVTQLILPGNHDLPYHNFDLLHKSSLGVLLNGNRIMPLGADMGEIVCVHTLVWPDNKTKPPQAPGLLPEELCAKYPNAKWIFTGDYHHNFIAYVGKQIVVNPGCITRQAADMKDYEPVIYLVDTEHESVATIYLPDTEDVVVDDYLQVVKERDERIESFIQLISNKKNVSLDYRENIRVALPQAPKEVQMEIKQILEEVK